MKPLVATILIMLTLAALANAEEGSAMIGAGLAVGLASVGAGIAVGLASAAAISALVEKPEERVWYLIFVAIGEAIAIYGLLISLIIIFG